MAEQVFLFRKAVEFGEQTLRELRGRGLEDEEIGLVRLYLKYKGIGFRYENWELGFAYYMKYTRDAYSGDGELKFVLEDESDVPDWQRRVRDIDETLRLMDERDLRALYHNVQQLRFARSAAPSSWTRHGAATCMSSAPIWRFMPASSGLLRTRSKEGTKTKGVITCLD